MANKPVKIALPEDKITFDIGGHEYFISLADEHIAACQAFLAGYQDKDFENLKDEEALPEVKKMLTEVLDHLLQDGAGAEIYDICGGSTHVMASVMEAVLSEYAERSGSMFGDRLKKYLPN